MTAILKYLEKYPFQIGLSLFALDQVGQRQMGKLLSSYKCHQIEQAHL